MDRVRLVLVDDSRDFSKVASRFLSKLESLELVGLGSRAEDALELVVRLLPDVVLLDLAMPGKGGLAVIPELKAAHPDLKIVVLTLFSAGGYRQAALEAGADAFVAKKSMGVDLLPAILGVAREVGPASRLSQQGGRTDGNV